MEQSKHLSIFWTLFVHEQWRFFMAATTKGLCYVGSPGQPFEVMADWVGKHFPAYSLFQDDFKLQPYMKEFEEYFKGERHEFTLPVDFTGTPFQMLIWNTLKEIPYGQTYSYTDVAELIQHPAAVRAVGATIGANPVLILIPCHRVIAKSGSLTGYRGGLEMKKKAAALGESKSRVR
ncbi:methylated-DNA--[protein]-cysteine S-methyltransferase [Brevibacillus daliensis]|uniref:methylated-DNA--[protein]-cysteine S-methyltransferase n=1 Tax=Brevibacillus daliensis TaxID=2892995 RepID=UPI001E398910|nr:methylated-DNA--[protein]-cysteine S-methyltransferase [Brevibacillus daliensis]